MSPRVSASSRGVICCAVGRRGGRNVAGAEDSAERRLILQRGEINRIAKRMERFTALLSYSSAHLLSAVPTVAAASNRPQASCSAAKDTKYLAQNAFFLLGLFLLLSAGGCPAAASASAAGCRTLAHSAQHSQGQEAAADCPSVQTSARARAAGPIPRFCPPCIWQYCVGSLPSMKYSFVRLRARRGGQLAALRIDGRLHHAIGRHEGLRIAIHRAAPPRAS